MSLLDLLTEQPQAITVGALTAQIRDALEVEFCDVFVEGEISNFKKHSSGHWYFTLKDQQAQLKCAFFRNQNLYIRFRPQDGIKVRVRGRISVYDPRGEYQLIISSMEPVGKGALQLAFEQLKNQLALEGLFDDSYKKPLPHLPNHLGIVTSPTGAVVRDMLNILARRNRMVKITIYPARVQGDGAAEEIASGIEYFNSREEIDVLIIGRGGGSIEDLWPFNEERLARAIFASKIPIISAVGHETDFTIADFVADYRASTPSAAAEIVAPHRDELAGLLLGYRETLISSLQYRLLANRSNLNNLRASRGFERFTTLLHRYQQQLDHLKHDLTSSMQEQLNTKQERVTKQKFRLTRLDLRSNILIGHNRSERLFSRLTTVVNEYLIRSQDRLKLNAEKLNTLSPLAVLNRGYALVWNDKEQLVKSTSQVQPGDKIRIRVANGEMTCIRDLE